MDREKQEALAKEYEGFVNHEMMARMGLQGKRVVESLIFAIREGLLEKSIGPDAVMGLGVSQHGQKLGMDSVGDVMHQIISHMERDWRLVGYTPANEPAVEVKGKQSVKAFQLTHNMVDKPHGCDLWVMYMDGDIETVWCMSLLIKGQPMSVDFSMAEGPKIPFSPTELRDLLVHMKAALAEHVDTE